MNLPTRRSPLRPSRSAMSIAEISVLVGVLAVVALLVFQRYHASRRHASPSRIRSDMRSMATALASYFVDYNSYPPCVILAESDRHVRNSVEPGSVRSMTSEPIQIFSKKAPTPTNRQRPTFAIAGEVAMSSGSRPEFFSLTTPISYITVYFTDEFSNDGRETFSYLADRKGYIMASYGPDRDEGKDVARKGDLGSLVRTMREQYLTATDRPFDGMDLAGSAIRLKFGTDATTGEAFTYDPTNGTTSAGDIWRIAD